MIILIKIVLLKVNHGNRLINKYQNINNLGSTFEKYTLGLPKAVLINSSLMVSTLSTSFNLAVKSIDMSLLYSPNKFCYRYSRMNIYSKTKFCNLWQFKSSFLPNINTIK